MRPSGRSLLAAVAIALILAVAPLLGSPSPTQAAGFTVNSTADEPDTTPGDGACVSTPSGACTLRAAVMEANALLGADTITVPAGTYTLSRVELPGRDDSFDDTGAFGDLDLLGSVTIAGSGTDATIVAIGGQLRRDRIFDVIGASTEVTLTRLTVTGGNVAEAGGGIRNREGSLTLQNVALLANRSVIRGGGLQNGGTATLTDVTIAQNNQTEDAVAGAGIANSGLLNGTRVVLRDNGIGYTDAIGSGLYNDSGAAALLVDSVVRSNTARNGGGIWNSANASLTLNRVEVGENIARIIPLSPTAGLGGGIHNRGQLDATNVTVSGNRADQPGAGLYNGSGGRARLTYVTFSGNESAGLGKSIMNDGGTAEIRGSILFHAAGGNCAGTITSGGFNVDSGDTCDFGGVTERENTDPLLGPLAENGGFGRTHALPAGSVAIDLADDPSCPAVDQRGQPRPRDGNGDGRLACDAGAFETQSAPAQIGCVPRPPVRVSVVRGEPGTLLATVEATGTPGGTPNVVRALRFERMANVLVDVAGQTGVSSGQVVTIPPNTSRVLLTVRRGPNGPSATASFVVVDVCGEWPTLVGGGPDAWSPPPAPSPSPAAVPRPPAWPAVGQGDRDTGR